LQSFAVVVTIGDTLDVQFEGCRPSNIGRTRVKTQQKAERYLGETSEKSTSMDICSCTTNDRSSIWLGTCGGTCHSSIGGKEEYLH